MRKILENRKTILPALAAVLLMAIYLLYLLFGIKSVLVISNSMWRYAPQGSIVLIKKSNMYRIGDVITFKFKNTLGNLITHRINNIKEIGNTKLFYTKGDNNNFNDPVPISEDEVIGRVFLVIPHVGKIILFIFKPWVLFIIYYVPAGFCLGNLLKSLNE